MDRHFSQMNHWQNCLFLPNLQLSYFLSCLLEVNASPSLTASSQEDCELKCHLLEDTLHIVDREGRQAGKDVYYLLRVFIKMFGMDGLVPHLSWQLIIIL